MSKQTPHGATSKGSSDAKFVLVSQRKLIVEEPDDPASAEVFQVNPDLKSESKSLSNLGGMRVAGTTGSALPNVYVGQTYQSRTQYVTHQAITALPINRGFLSCSPGAYAYVTNSAARGIASSFRLKQVLIWPGVASSGSQTVETSLLWVGNTAEQALGKDEPRERAIPSGVTRTGALSFKPPKGSWHAMWQFANENPSDFILSLLNIPIGSVVRVDLEFTLPSQQSSYSFTQGSTVAGAFGYPALDGPTTNQVRPISCLATII